MAEVLGRRLSRDSTPLTQALSQREREPASPPSVTPTPSA
jgi:hypothetical protein